MKDGLNLTFRPMYSGFDGVHTYKIPLTYMDNGFTDPTQVKWTASDPSMVDIMDPPQSMNPSPADMRTKMLVTKKAGTVTITVETPTAMGTSRLTIAPYTLEQWTAGETRYKSGTPTNLRDHLFDAAAGDKYVQCLSCHGKGASDGQIPHTPKQTGGFTDDQIKGIILMGKLPDSQGDIGIPAKDFMALHSWMAADEEITGLLAYLRSLEPLDWNDADPPQEPDGGYEPPPFDGGPDDNADGGGTPAGSDMAVPASDMGMPSDMATSPDMAHFARPRHRR